MNLRAMANGKTQRMLEKVRDSRAALAIVVAHSDRYARELARRYADLEPGSRMSRTQDLVVERADGRPVRFQGPNAQYLRGMSPEVLVVVDHYAWTPGVLSPILREDLVRALLVRTKPAEYR